MDRHQRALTQAHQQNLHRARQLFFEAGQPPEHSVAPLVLRSWTRCLRFGLDTRDTASGIDTMDRSALKIEQQRQDPLRQQSRAIMAHLYEQIRDSGSMVILADAHGLVLDTLGDPDFVDRADRVLLSAGACWDENRRGTNAIGTALAEETPVEILGAEHFLEHNSFLTCCASPIFGPNGQLIGVLDISGDYRNEQRHTLGLVRMSAGMIERRLFKSLHAQDLILAFHPDVDALGSPSEGLLALSPEGEILSVNRAALALLQLRLFDVLHRDFSLIFDASLNTLIDLARNRPGVPHPLSQTGPTLWGHLRGKLPTPRYQLKPESHRNSSPIEDAIVRHRGPQTLNGLSGSDPQLQKAIDQAQRIVGRDIPLLIQGESGVGKEVFAKAFHHSGKRRQQAFVAVNCAAIPEHLIESELFGYQGGAFTGARKEGAVGKIQQANGGTLFLDEIGDMPLSLQARLLRVLQERQVTPVGSTQCIPVDISLIGATHRHLREEIAQGRFREDLYYRLAGLTVTLPSLRARQDVIELAEHFAEEESRDRPQPVTLSDTARLLISAYPWPGNIRQLANAIRVAVALLDAHETQIQPRHLPDELSQPMVQRRVPAEKPAPAARPEKLEELSKRAAQEAVDLCGGNLSAAARSLGISRNTLYRKLGKS